MAGIEPETEKPNPVKPGDGWRTTNEHGQPVERIRNAAGDGWDEFPLEADMPMTLVSAHDTIVRLHMELADIRRRFPEARGPSAPPPPRPDTSPAPLTASTTKPCGGCGKKDGP